MLPVNPASSTKERILGAAEQPVRAARLRRRIAAPAYRRRQGQSGRGQLPLRLQGKAGRGSVPPPPGCPQRGSPGRAGPGRRQADTPLWRTCLPPSSVRRWSCRMKAWRRCSCACWRAPSPNTTTSCASSCRDNYGHVMRQFTAEFARLLPQLSKQELYWRIDLVTGALTHAMSGFGMIQRKSDVSEQRASRADRTAPDPLCRSGSQPSLDSVTDRQRPACPHSSSHHHRTIGEANDCCILPYPRPAHPQGRRARRRRHGRADRRPPDQRRRRNRAVRPARQGRPEERHRAEGHRQPEEAVASAAGRQGPGRARSSRPTTTTISSSCKDCDLVIEAIAERMDWKLDLYRKIAPHRRPTRRSSPPTPRACRSPSWPKRCRKKCVTASAACTSSTRRATCTWSS